MRQFLSRPTLPSAIQKRLSQQTRKIINAADQKAEADRRYKNARDAQWFRPVISSLRQLAGTGERCMFCSGSESSEVEHYRPKATFPELALTWKNMLWACGICNRAKSNRFPVEAEQLLIDPLSEKVWDYFFIDEFGNLTARWSTMHDDYHPRAVSTMSIVALDRQALQEARQQRLINLKERVSDCLILLKNGDLSKTQVKKRIQQWRNEAFQPDVADYFLNGPGQQEEPFSLLFSLLR